jgi:hypothetical protein
VSVLSNIIIVSCLVIIFCLKGIVLFDYIICLLLSLANFNLNNSSISITDVCINSINKVSNFNMTASTSEKVMSSMELLMKTTGNTTANIASITVLCISSFTMSSNQSISSTILNSLNSEIHSNMSINQPPTFNLKHIVISLIYIITQVAFGSVLGVLIRNFIVQIYPVVNKHSKTGNIFASFFSIIMTSVLTIIISFKII